MANLTDAEKEQVAALVHSLIGYQMTLDKEEEIAAITGCDAEDAALDHNIERCQECGIWTQSCNINANLAADGEVICVDCIPEGEEDGEDD
ncbi:hypothetical protein M5E06_13285 [Azospirillum sp. A1-3]|uniref:hypothetical protein n=1 Tax=Azospirillum sp. A1-3 TaxID=185874 RepID=UPI002077097F|nr:hypothetical protein [Azospirillum sp. A1-3]MCM8735156.1 hypothetical protein [Azospirillum sp. A1-3]